MFLTTIHYVLYLYQHTPRCRMPHDLLAITNPSSLPGFGRPCACLRTIIPCRARSRCALRAPPPLPGGCWCTTRCWTLRLPHAQRARARCLPRALSCSRTRAVPAGDPSRGAHYNAHARTSIPRVLYFIPCALYRALLLPYALPPTCAPSMQALSRFFAPMPPRLRVPYVRAHAVCSTTPLPNVTFVAAILPRTSLILPACGVWTRATCLQILDAAPYIADRTFLPAYLSRGFRTPAAARAGFAVRCAAHWRTPLPRCCRVLPQRSITADAG